MEHKELKYVLEAVLFAAGEPVSLNHLSEAIELTNSETKDLLDELQSEYDYSIRGIKLVRMNQTYQLVSRSDYYDYIKKVIKTYQSSALSQAALETLAIVAYKQPVTRADIEQIRGVQSSSSLDLLIDRGLVKAAGKLDVPGKPLAFDTTPEFLKLMNIEKFTELPSYDEFLAGIQLALEEEKSLQE